jgi:hypothetical protein
VAKTRDTVNCPYCLSPIEGDAEQIRCPVCGVAHHAECWQMNGKCSVYGCDGWQSWSGAISDKIAPRIKEDIEIDDAETEKPTPSKNAGPLCMECGQPVKPGRLVCGACRGDWRPAWLENCFGPMLIAVGVFVGIISLIVKGLS